MVCAAGANKAFILSLAFVPTSLAALGLPTYRMELQHVSHVHLNSSLFMTLEPENVSALKASKMPVQPSDPCLNVSLSVEMELLSESLKNVTTKTHSRRMGATEIAKYNLVLTVDFSNQANASWY